MIDVLLVLIGPVLLVVACIVLLKRLLVGRIGTRMIKRKVWGVIDNDGVFHDVSLSDIGAKRMATTGGYPFVGYRNDGSYHPVRTHVKNGKGQWVTA